MGKTSQAEIYFRTTAMRSSFSMPRWSSMGFRKILNLGNLSQTTMKELMTRPGIIRMMEEDRVKTTILVTRAILKKIRKSTIEWEGGRDHQINRVQTKPKGKLSPID